MQRDWSDENIEGSVPWHYEKGSQLTSGRNGQFYFDLGQAGKLECLRTGGLITQKNFMKSERGTVKLSRFETQVTFFWSCPNRQ